MFKVERTHMVKWSLVVVIGLGSESDFSQPLYFPETTTGLSENGAPQMLMHHEHHH
jgi:hypothetical protein